MTWYCLRTAPQQERTAASELRRAGLRVYLPKRSYETVHKRSNKRLVRYRPLWIGYLLVRFPGAVPAFGLIRDCKGVHDFVKWMTEAGEFAPVPLRDSVVAAYMRRQRARDYDGARMAAIVRAAKRRQFKLGTMVRINDGPFASFLGKIERIDDDNTAHLLGEIFGRETTITIDNFEERVTPVARSAA